MTIYRLKRDRYRMKAGTVVTTAPDWGLANLDSRVSGKPHVSVTPTGTPPTFSVPVEDLEAMDERP